MLVAGFPHLCLLQLLATHQVARMVWRPPCGSPAAIQRLHGRRLSLSRPRWWPGCVEVVTSGCVKSGGCRGCL